MKADSAIVCSLPRERRHKAPLKVSYVPAPPSGTPTTEVFRYCFQLPARTLLLLIRLYQRTLSPALPVFLGSACGCRFSPTCSHYMSDAIRTHGVMGGTFLGIVRLLKCTPLHPGGFDPIPSRRTTPRCGRAS